VQLWTGQVWAAAAAACHGHLCHAADSTRGMPYVIHSASFVMALQFWYELQSG
jgi:hypothetical protein